MAPRHPHVLAWPDRIWPSIRHPALSAEPPILMQIHRFEGHQEAMQFFANKIRGSKRLARAHPVYKANPDRPLGHTHKFLYCGKMRVVVVALMCSSFASHLVQGRLHHRLQGRKAHVNVV